MVILSTHIVEDVRELCSRMAILSKGRVLLRGEPGALVAQLEGRVWRKAVGRSEVAGTWNRCQFSSRGSPPGARSSTCWVINLRATDSSPPSRISSTSTSRR